MNPGSLKRYHTLNLNRPDNLTRATGSRTTHNKSNHLYELILDRNITREVVRKVKGESREGREDGKEGRGREGCETCGRGVGKAGGGGRRRGL